MSYALDFYKQALKEFEKLPKAVISQFLRKLEERCENPHIPSARLGNDLKGCYKIKIKGYRLVYRAEDKVLVIVVVAVGKRANSEIYKTAGKRLDG